MTRLKVSHQGAESKFKQERLWSFRWEPKEITYHDLDGRNIVDQLEIRGGTGRPRKGTQGVKS